jgi:hypothetical protein
MRTVYNKLQNKTLPLGWAFNSDSFCCSEVSLGKITFKWRSPGGEHTDYSIEMLTDLHIPSFTPYQASKVDRTVYDEATYVVDPVTGKEIKNQKSYKVIYMAYFQYQSDGNFHVTGFYRSKDSETMSVGVTDWEYYNYGIMWMSGFWTPPDRNKALSNFKYGANMGHPGCKKMVNALNANINASLESLGLESIPIPAVDTDLDAGSSSSSSSSSSYSGSSYSSSSYSRDGIGSKLLGVLFGIIGAVILTVVVLIVLSKNNFSGAVKALGLLGGPVVGFILGWKISRSLAGKLIIIAALIGGGIFFVWFNWSILAPYFGKDKTPTEITAETRTVTGNVNFRAGPSTGDNIIRQLQQGDTVTLTGETNGGWTQVSHNGETGWVSSEFLNK